jgi:iron complex transport system substrate-binding protein
VTLSPTGAARLCSVLLAIGLLAGCGGVDVTPPEPSPTGPAAVTEAPPSETANLTDGCIETFDEGVDYFPSKVTFDEATGVTVTYEDSYKVVEVTTLDGAAPQRYVLLQCGADEPELTGPLAKAQVVEVPVDNVITLTTTNLPHFDELGAVETVTGVGTGDFVTTQSILDRIAAGEVRDYATAEGQPETEKIIGAQPDVLIVDAFGDAIVEEAQRFYEANVPTVLNADFNEQTLLGRAEWLKFTALFLNAEEAAQQRYDEIAGAYNDVRDAAAAADQRPSVFVNTPIEGTWFMPGGNSYLAGAIEDANGEYVFGDDDSTYSLELDIETVLDKADDADVWLQAGSVSGSLKDLAGVDERFKEFKAFKDGQVWAYDKSLSPGGGNAVFETAYTRADVFLSDLVKILHPDALPDHELVFFGQVPRTKK